MSIWRRYAKVKIHDPPLHHSFSHPNNKAVFFFTQPIFHGLPSGFWAPAGRAGSQTPPPPLGTSNTATPDRSDTKELTKGGGKDEDDAT